MVKLNNQVNMKFDKIYEKYRKKLKSKGMSIAIENEDRSFQWAKSYGELEGDKQYFIASVTKLFATTVLLNLITEGKLSFDDRICDYLPQEYIDGFHTYRGADYSKQLTVRHLMTQTSGLPDYFTESNVGELYGNELLKQDQILTLDDIVRRTINMEAKFLPGSKKRAYYSDANWDIFLPIVERVSNQSIEQCYKKYIIEPLQLENTYLYIEGMEFNVPGIWIDDGIYTLPKLASAWPMSGSIISNNRDMIIFLKAFWGGKLFPYEKLKENNTYHYTQYFPLEYGLGNMRFRYPGMPSLYGHSGATGVVCYYSPKFKIYISACINELDEGKVTRMLARFAHEFRKVC